GFTKRREILERSWRSAQEHFDKTQVQQQQALQQEHEETLLGIKDHHDAAHLRLTEEFNARKSDFQEKYTAEKQAVESRFKESHWTIHTLNESDRRVARDQVRRAQHKLKKNRSELKTAYRKAHQLVHSWKFAHNLPVSLNHAPKIMSNDPWANLE